VTRDDVRFVPAGRVVVHAVVATVATLWLVASPPASAWVTFNSTDIALQASGRSRGSALLLAGPERFKLPGGIGNLRDGLGSRFSQKQVRRV